MNSSNLHEAVTVSSATVIGDVPSIPCPKIILA